MPKTTFLIRIDPKTWADHLEEAGHSGAVLIRPLGTHGGKGLVRVDFPNEVPEVEPSPGGYLVSDFADTRSADGLYRKYRVVLAGGRLFHRHLIASDTWMVGPDSRRIMRERPALIAEEKAFMDGALGELDERLVSQFSRLGLDFGAADFAVSDAGEITFFEINPCFQIIGSVPPEYRERWGYVEQTNTTIIDALFSLIEDRAS